MSYFKAKMHLIRFRLRVRFSSSPNNTGELTMKTPQLDLSGPTSKGKEGRGREGGMEGKERA